MNKEQELARDQYYNLCRIGNQRLRDGVKRERFIHAIHHITPRWKFRDGIHPKELLDDISNLSLLTHAEHFKAHMLLAVWDPHQNNIGTPGYMTNGYWSKGINCTPEEYEQAKTLSLKARSLWSTGKKWSDESRMKLSKSRTGVKVSEATKQKMRKPKSEQHRVNAMEATRKSAWKISEAMKEYNRNLSEEQRLVRSRNISIARRGKPLKDNHRHNLSESLKGRKLALSAKLNYWISKYRGKISKLQLEEPTDYIINKINYFTSQMNNKINELNQLTAIEALLAA